MVSPHDSDVVRIIREAGAVFFCRTAMPQTGFILETVSNLWGRTLNPYNKLLGARGSSGGDAALVAMRGCPIAPSTDAGGSIRAPAAFNGLYGIRPTAVRIPKNLWEGTMSGQVAIRDSAGPVCHSMDDIRIFTQLLTTNEKSRYDTNAVPLP
jgi:amidase